MSSPKEFIEETIKSNKIVVFSKSYCPYCTMAKKAFESLSEAFNAIELDLRDDGDQIQAALHSISNVKTVPQVFVNGKYIGGGTDTKKKSESGELRKIIDGVA